MFGIFADRQAIPRDQADQHDDHVHDGREDRPANAEIGEDHESFAVLAGATVGAALATASSLAVVCTAMPSRSFNCPAVTIRSFGADAAAHFYARVFALADQHFGQRDAAVATR